jgi:hypothetical protein
VRFAIGDPKEDRDVPPRIQEGVELDGTAFLLKESPGEEIQVEIKGCRVERIDGLLEFEIEALARVEAMRFVNETLCEIGVDPLISLFVGFSESRPRNRGAAKSQMVEFLGNRTKQASISRRLSQ